MTTTNTILDTAPCRAKCAGGHKCACVGRRHSHHICHDPACACHAAASYGLELEQQARGVLVYAKARRAVRA